MISTLKVHNPPLSSENIAVVIPSYNHNDTVRSVVEGVLEYHSSVVVVDDGSNTPVEPLLEGLNVTVIRHEKNLGKGSAIKTACRWAVENGKSHIITIDADAQHFPESIPQFIDAVIENPNSICIGVRRMGSDVPASSRFGRSFGNFWVRIQTGIKVKDIQSGYRAYPVFVVESISTMFSTYAFEVEIVVRALWAGVALQEIPVDVHYAEKDKRVSHFHRLKDNFRITILNTWLIIRAVLPWPYGQIRYSDNTFTAVKNPRDIIRIELKEKHQLPRQVASAAALGIFLGTLPLIACHIVVIIYVSAMLKLSRAISVLVSHLCAPPWVPLLSIEVGHLVRTGGFLTVEGLHRSENFFNNIGSLGLQCIIDWVIGSLIVGPVLAAGIWLFVFVAAKIMQRKINAQQK